VCCLLGVSLRLNVFTNHAVDAEAPRLAAFRLVVHEPRMRALRPRATHAVADLPNAVVVVATSVRGCAGNRIGSAIVALLRVGGRRRGKSTAGRQPPKTGWRA